MKWDGNDVIYNARVKNDIELYVTGEALVMTGKHESDFFQMEIKRIRCALAYGERVKIFWRRPERFGDESDDRWLEGGFDIVLDLKKMYPDNKERNNAKKTESNRMATIILKTVQDAYTGNTPILNDCLAMYTNEHLVKSYKGYARGTFGRAYITNLGIYFVAKGIGLAFNMPFAYINGVTQDTDAINIYHLVPMYVIRQNNRNTNTFVIRMLGDDFTDAYEIISKIIGKNKRTYSYTHSSNNPSDDSSTTIQSPLDILKMKLINDEITEEEYERKKKILTD